MNRLTYFMEVAIFTSKRGTCKRLQVGCVLVDAITNRIAAIGYNSSHSKTPHCIDNECLLVDGHCVRTLHAEQAAVMNLERKHQSLICFTTNQPCINCFKILAAAHVQTIYYVYPYVDDGRDLLNKEVKIPMIKLREAVEFKTSNQVWEIEV